MEDSLNWVLAQLDRRIEVPDQSDAVRFQAATNQFQIAQQAQLEEWAARAKDHIRNLIQHTSDYDVFFQAVQWMAMESTQPETFPVPPANPFQTSPNNNYSLGFSAS